MKYLLHFVSNLDLLYDHIVYWLSLPFKHSVSSVHLCMESCTLVSHEPDTLIQHTQCKPLLVDACDMGYVVWVVLGIYVIVYYMQFQKM